MRILIAVAVLLCVACGSDGTEPLHGAAHFAILSGNHQTATVAAAHLPKPVEGQLYRKADGSVALRVLDALLPAKAYAQTVVQGAGIAGAVVCWADSTSAPRLIPFSPCVNTGTDGMVAFNLHPDTAAGEAIGSVHWDSSGVPKVTAVVTATINAGPAGPKFCWQGSLKLSPYLITGTVATDAYGNVIPWHLTGDSIVAVSGDTLTYDDTPLAFGNTGTTGTLALTDSTGAAIGNFQYHIGAATGQLSWKSYGFEATASCFAPLPVS
jgi:hypothetical protein